MRSISYCDTRKRCVKEIRIRIKGVVEGVLAMLNAIVFSVSRIERVMKHLRLTSRLGHNWVLQHLSGDRTALRIYRVVHFRDNDDQQLV